MLYIKEEVPDEEYKLIIEKATCGIEDFDYKKYLIEHPVLEKGVLKKCWVLHTSSPNMCIRKKELIDCLWIFLRTRMGEWKSIEKEDEQE